MNKWMIQASIIIALSTNQALANSCVKQDESVLAELKYLQCQVDSLKSKIDAENSNFLEGKVYVKGQCFEPKLITRCFYEDKNTSYHNRDNLSWFTGGVCEDPSLYKRKEGVWVLAEYKPQ